MANLPCPLPQVHEALAPFIRNRQETLRIRKDLTEYFQSHFQGTEQPLTPLTLAFPSSLPENKQHPPELTGLRKRYWDAVRARAAAERRRDALSAELTELRRSHIEALAKNPRDTGRAPSAAENDGVQAYVALLQQRRRANKLQILQDTLDQMADAEPNPLRRDFQAWLDEKLGDVPMPPPETAGDDGAVLESGGASDQVLRLKKELLQAKRNLDVENERRTALRERLAVVPKQGFEQQVFALRCARDELIAWIEGELAKLAELEESSLTPLRQEHVELHGERDVRRSDVPYQEQVEMLYERYVAARAALVSAVETVTAATNDVNTAPSLESLPKSSMPDTSEKSSQRKLAPSEVLPYIPALLQSAKDERALAQQTTYVRHRLAKAQEETRSIMQRLASESHMVPPGADSALVWAHAAQDAAKNTERVVAEHLSAGEANISGAKAILAELEARTDAFDRLRTDV